MPWQCKPVVFAHPKVDLEIYQAQLFANQLVELGIEFFVFDPSCLNHHELLKAPIAQKKFSVWGLMNCKGLEIQFEYLFLFVLVLWA